MDRLEFLQKAGFLTATVLAGTLISCGGDDEALELEKPIDVDLANPSYADLEIEGEWLLHPEVNVLIVNVNSDIRAFSSVCPHRQCTRDWNYSPGVFVCTCHNSRFDATGQYLSGPANANLRELSVVREGDILTIGG